MLLVLTGFVETSELSELIAIAIQITVGDMGI